MPQLVKLQDELRDSGFVVMAPHVQNGTEEEVAKVARGLKINFTVTEGSTVPGESVSGIPAAFLFDASGKLVSKGHPSSMKQEIHDLVKKEPHFLAAGRTYTKHKATAEMLKTTKVYGTILKKLEKDLKGTGAAADEAKYLSERILQYGGKKLDEAKSMEAEQAFQANALYTDLSSNWKGTAPGDKASARLKELKADKAFQEELKAGQMAQQIRAECDKLIIQGGKLNLDYTPNVKIAATVKGSFAALKKKYPESKATALLKKELEGNGFKGI